MIWLEKETKKELDLSIFISLQRWFRKLYVLLRQYKKYLKTPNSNKIKLLNVVCVPFWKPCLFNSSVFVLI